MAKAVWTLVLVHNRNHVGDLAAWPPRSLHCWCSTTTCGCLWTRLSGWDGGTAAGRPERILGTTPVLACGRQPACTGAVARALLACAACLTRWIRARCSCSPLPGKLKGLVRATKSVALCDTSHTPETFAQDLVIKGHASTAPWRYLCRTWLLKAKPHPGGVRAGPGC